MVEEQGTTEWINYLSQVLRKPMCSLWIMGCGLANPTVWHRPGQSSDSHSAPAPAFSSLHLWLCAVGQWEEQSALAISSLVETSRWTLSKTHISLSFSPPFPPFFQQNLLQKGKKPREHAVMHIILNTFHWTWCEKWKHLIYEWLTRQCSVLLISRVYDVWDVMYVCMHACRLAWAQCKCSQEIRATRLHC